MKTQLIKDLEYALSFKRPHGGTGVTALCNYIVERVGEGDLSVDFCGNIHVDMRDDSSNETMFTAHVDTVHREDGFNIFKYESISAHMIKISRDAELDIDSDLSKSFIDKISLELCSERSSSS